MRMLRIGIMAGLWLVVCIANAQTEPVTFSRDGRFVALAVVGSVAVWSIETGKVAAEIKIPAYAAMIEIDARSGQPRTTVLFDDGRIATLGRDFPMAGMSKAMQTVRQRVLPTFSPDRMFQFICLSRMLRSHFPQTSYVRWTMRREAPFSHVVYRRDEHPRRLIF